ncbi:hypothetical protein M422DRAFT_33679, partial [Sphaerobolus stellatus SS14]
RHCKSSDRTRFVNTSIGKLSETYRWFKDLLEKTFWSWFQSGGGEGGGWSGMFHRELISRSPE